MSDTTLMHICWRLSDGEYDPQSGAIIHTPDLLRKMADNLALLNAESYRVSISGKGHPFYYEIIEYLAMSNVPGYVEVEIGIGENVSSWARILPTLPPNRLLFKLAIPAKPELYKSALEAIASFANSGQKVEVEPARDAALATILKQFQQTVPFEIAGQGPEASKSASPSEPGTQKQAPVGIGRDPQALYCHMGDSYYSITPSGHLLTANCAQGIDLGSFWKLGEEDLAALPVVVKCKRGDCPHARLFGRKQNGEAKKRIGARPDPAWMFVLSELEQLQAAHFGASKVGGPARIWELPAFAENRDSIIAIYRHLADRDSRNAFLRSVAAAITGNTACLRQAEYPKAAHPEIKSRPEDVQFWEDGRYCQWFAPQEPVALTSRLDGMLKLHLPKVAIPINRESLFAIPERLIELGYELYWGWHGENLGMAYGFHPEQLAPTHSVASRLGLISIIVPFYNNEDTIRRCILSACAQGIENFEVIAVDDGSTDDSAQIVAELAAMWPRHIRLKRLEKNMGPGYARNFGMSIATGEFMTFIDADDALAPDFLRKSMPIMQSQNADIVAFDLLHIHKGREPIVWDIKEGVYSGWKSLEQLLFKDAGRYATYSRLYRTEFLRKNNIRYSDTRVHQDIFFSVLAFLYSRKTVVVPEIGYLRFQRPGVSHAAGYHGPRQLEAFASFARFMDDLFEANGLDKGSEAYKYCIRRLYTWDRERMYKAIRETPEDDPTIRAAIANLGHSMEALKLILHDYAMAHVSGKPDAISVLPRDRDWRDAALQPPAGIVCEAFGSADNHWNQAPELSIIIPSYNSRSYIRNCLESVYRQDFANLEIIIIDDASTDGSYDILREEAASNNKIRLYRLKNNCRQGIARNIGMEKANGKYIIFVDADDICFPGYFKDAYKSIESTRADIVFFSSEHEYAKGAIWRPPFESEKAFSRSEALVAFWEGRLGVEPWAKIFRNSTLKMHGCKFPPHIYHQDVPFLFDAIKSSQKIVIKPRNVYRRVYSDNSSLRPKTANYLQIRSAYAFYWLMNRAAGASQGEYRKKEPSFVKWNLENVLLDKIAAYARALNEVPMTVEDYDLLRKNESFLTDLMEGAASAIPEEGYFRGKLETQFRAARTWRGEGIDPLATVLVFRDSAHRDATPTLNSVLAQSMAWLQVAVAEDGASMEEDLDLEAKDARISLLDARARDFSIEQALEDCAESGSRLVAISRAGYRFEPDTFMIASAFMEMDGGIQGAIPIKTFEADKNIPEKFRADYLKMSGPEVAEAILLGWLDASVLLGSIWRKDFIRQQGASIDKRNVLPWLFQLCSSAGTVALYKADAIPEDGQPESPVFSEIVEMLGVANDLVAYNPGLEAYLQDERNRIFIDAYLDSLLERVAAIPIAGPGEMAKKYLAKLGGMRFIIGMLLRKWANGMEEENTGWSQDLSASPATQLLPVADSPGTGSPLLSLIVYTYNPAGPVRDVLTALIEQCSGEVEIILIDDGSEIACGQIYRDFCEKVASRHDAKFRIFETQWHSGVGAVWKIGLEKAEGSYVAFMRLGEVMPEGWVAEALAAGNEEATFWGQHVNDRQDAILKLLKNEIGATVYQINFIKERAALDGGMALADLCFPLLALREAKQIAWHRAMLPYERHQVFDADHGASVQDMLDALRAILELLKKEEAGEAGSSFAKLLFQPGSGAPQWFLKVIRQGVPQLDAALFEFCADDAVILELLRALVRSAELTVQP